VLLAAHAACGSPRGSSRPLIISAIADRCAPLFEVGDLSTEKGDTDIRGLNFRGQPASHLFAACVFGRIIDAVHFFIISATLGFQENHSNGTIVLRAFPAGSSWPIAFVCHQTSPFERLKVGVEATFLSEILLSRALDEDTHTFSKSICFFRARG
jgi:hypothetical protein